MASDSQRISDFDPRVVYLPSVAAPGTCSSDASDEACASRWWKQDDVASSVSLHATWGPDTSCELSFTGDSVQLYGTTSGAGAVGRAAVDGQLEVIVDFVSADAETHNGQLLLNLTGLGAPGTPHTLRLRYDATSFGAAPARRLMLVDWFAVARESISSSSSQTSSPPGAPIPGPSTTVVQISSIFFTQTVTGAAIAAVTAQSNAAQPASQSSLSQSQVTQLVDQLSTSPPSSTPGSSESGGIHVSTFTTYFPAESPTVAVSRPVGHTRVIVPVSVVGAIITVGLLVLVVVWQLRRRRFARYAGQETVRPYTVAMAAGQRASLKSHPTVEERVSLPPPERSPRASIDSGQTKVEVV